MAHPTDAWPRPSSWDQCVNDMRFEVKQADGTFACVEDRDLWMCFEGSVYPDGSCQPHLLSELSRAGWAAAMLDDTGQCAAVVSGTVPSCIGQTSYASEWCAAAITAHLAIGEVDGAQDCKGVVEEWAKPLAYQLRPSSVHAGQSRELLAYKSASLVTLRWVKGHVLEAAAQGEQARRDAKGNGIADKAANEARARHPAPTVWLAGKVAREVQDVRDVMLHAARILPLWPRVSKEELKAARPPRRRRGPRIPQCGHVWVHNGERWQCRTCLAAAFTQEAVEQRRGEECPGSAVRIRSVVEERRGHVLMIADVDGGPCLFCLCGMRCVVHHQAAQLEGPVQRQKGQRSRWHHGPKEVPRRVPAQLRGWAWASGPRGRAIAQ
jgi:hypothetical protein